MRICIVAFSLLIFASGCSKKQFREGGSSAMSPTIQPHESLVADMSAYRKSGPERWDVVVFHPPPAPWIPQKEVWDMRVIGLPGESLEIRDDGIYIDGKREALPDRLTDIRYIPSIPDPHNPTVSYPYKIPPDSYFLVGDNSKDSFDSRFWGALPRQSILGRVENK
jgi:signal peptidase I